MHRSTLLWLAAIVLAILAGLYVFGSSGTEGIDSGDQPSPHAIDQSE
jgi:hypothetical protein